MKKQLLLTVLLNLLFISTINSQFLINNNDIEFELAENSVQRHNESYKFHIKFKVRLNIGTDPTLNGLIGLYNIFIHQENNSHDWLSGNAPFSSDVSVSSGYISKEVIGSKDVYTYKSDLIDLHNINFTQSVFPNGNFKISIAGYKGGGLHAVVFNDGILTAGATNGSKNFSINDICTNCNNGIFIDQDTDGDGVYNNDDNCPYEVGTVFNDGCPVVDTDNDGVPDNQDDCPNEFGVSSNKGCPLPLGKPDLIITEVSVKIGDDTSIINLPLKKNTNHKFCVKIKNIGNSGGSSKNVELILSSGSNLLTSNKLSGLLSFNSNTIIQPGETIELCETKYFFDTYLGNSLSSYNYLHVIVDENDKVDEGYDGENNNTFINSVVYTASKTRGVSKKNMSLDLLSEEIFNNQSPYKISVYNIFGKRIIDKITVNNKFEENNILNNIVNGFYILKTDFKTRKILINNK